MLHKINELVGYNDIEDVFIFIVKGYYLSNGWWCDPKDGGEKVFKILPEDLQDIEEWKAKNEYLYKRKILPFSVRKETTRILSEHLEHFLNPYNDPRIYTAKEVTFDYATGHTVRVDYMRFLPKNNSADGIEQGAFYCYEVKSSVEDFHSPNGHNFIGDYNYYVMPEEVFKQVKEEIQGKYGGYVGVYVPEWNGLACVKKARKKERTRSTAEMLLMMFRSSNRELFTRKTKKKEQVDIEIGDTS